MKKIFGVILFITFIFAGAVLAGEGHAPIPEDPSAEFESLKSLAGRWEGTMTEKDGKVNPAAVEYKLTSGGKALVEVLGAGTEHEMHSVYFNQNGRLAMTHYCMLGNRPNLALKQSKEGEVFLDLAPSEGIDAAKDPHMHSLKLTFPDAETLKQEWTFYADGQASGITTLEFKRVK